MTRHAPLGQRRSLLPAGEDDRNDTIFISDVVSLPSFRHQHSLQSVFQVVIIQAARCTERGFLGKLHTGYTRRKKRGSTLRAISGL